MSKETYETFYVARQPILTLDKEVYGYELLFRQNQEARTAEIVDPQHATMSVASGGFLRSSEDLIAGQRLLINFTANLILDGTPYGLPPDRVVVEILESVDVTPELVQAVAKLKDEGYSFAIDDYTGDPSFDELLPLATIIKVDLMGVDEKMLPGVVQKARHPGVTLLAEKVEDAKTFMRCKSLGFELFQGYFFSKPVNLEGRRPPAASAGKLRILQQLNEELSLEQLTELVQSDPSLAYRLLRFLNSSAFSFLHEITSISHAVRLIGIGQVKHWLRLVVVAELKAKDASPELLMMSMTRAKYLELLADEKDKDSYFLLGLISLMDVVMQLPMSEVLSRVSLEQRLADALEEKPGRLHEYLESARCLERAEWSAVDAFIQEHGLDPSHVKQGWAEALVWATRAFSGVC
ncbi:EAL and HDOD domain-containing protein [Oceanidesulfovibrio marinus]|uniref:EAL domain-containing protein n=1 Tax=Oceanidesulfovibrio marinus TaxID=370038 RepID=A0ABX6NI41_9BACT|nr:EAL domain-containing protein [Oceanidesulfovibrio marinus]QJT10307.1 EAL domain-containing protein [Oceanidesulfovibrio marinus]